MKRLGKRGSVLDIFFIVIILFVFAIVLFVTKNFWIDLHTANVEDGGILGDSPEGQEIMNNGMSTMNSFNWMFPLILILLFIGVIVLATQIPINSGTIMVTVFIIIILVFVAGYFGTMFQDIAGEPEYANETATYNTINLTMTNFPKIIGIMGLVVVVVMFMVFKRGGE